jgi:hypothetical protein
MQRVFQQIEAGELWPEAAKQRQCLFDHRSITYEGCRSVKSRVKREWPGRVRRSN